QNEKYQEGDVESCVQLRLKDDADSCLSSSWWKQHGRQETLQGPGVGKTCYEGASFGHNTVNALVDSPQLYRPAEDPHGRVPINTSSWKGKGLMRPYFPPAKGY
ncbi:hypothetical protein STEG23_029929, partial [Scotinomys teguina]